MLLRNYTDTPRCLHSTQTEKKIVINRENLRQYDSFAELEVSDKFQKDCECVYCETDEDCGELWTGSVVAEKSHVSNFHKIHLIIAHCQHDLGWVSAFIEGFDIAEIIIISKCGHTVEGVPKGSKVIRLSNVGRNDHSYAHFMDIVYDANNQKNEAFIFLKDDFDVSNSLQPEAMRTMNKLLLVADTWGFACGRELGARLGLELSTYHYTPVLTRFSMADYERGRIRYNASTTEGKFHSEYENLADYMSSLDYSFPELTQVCYGGNFATTRKSIQRHPTSLWKNIRQSLTRGNNLEEGHFVERSWGGLLANPIKRYQMKALITYSAGITMSTASINGALQCPYNRLVKNLKDLPLN